MSLRTILAFLIARGWKIDRKNDRYFYLKPPTTLRFENPRYRMLLPRNENLFSDGDKFINKVVDNIAILYKEEFSKADLATIFAYSLDELETRRRKVVLAFNDTEKENIELLLQLAKKLGITVMGNYQTPNIKPITEELLAVASKVPQIEMS